jgi:Ca2+-binding RTX toxin-like protein
MIQAEFNFFGRYPMPIADLTTLVDASAQNLSQLKGLSVAYNLLGGAPSIAGYTALINGNNTSNFGAGAGVTFNDENVYINVLNALYQGNADAKAAFDAIVGGGATLSDKLGLVYNAVIPAASRTDAGLAYFKSQAAFYEGRAAELGVAGGNGAALVAWAALAKIAVDNDIPGLGDTVNDLVAAVKDGSAALPEDGTVFTPLETADGTNFDGDDVSSGGATATFALTTGLDFASESTSFINGAIPSTFKFTTADEAVVALDGTMAATDTIIDGSTGDNDSLTLNTIATAPVLGTVTNIENIVYNPTGTTLGAQNLATVTGAKMLSVSGTTGGATTFNNAGGTGITTYDFSGITTTGAAGGVTLNQGATVPTADLKITGGAGNDVLNGGNGADTILGGGGADTLNGAAGNDILTGGAGNDGMTGGAGDDTFNVDVGTDNIVDLATGDIVKISSGTTLTTTAGSISAFVATADTSHASAVTATLNSAAGGSTIDVSLATGTGTWTINGGAGVDTLIGSANNDIITTGGGATNSVTGGKGADAMTSAGTADTFVIAMGDSGLTTASADAITGFGSGADFLKVGLAGTGVNFVDGASGAIATVEAAVTAANLVFNGTVRHFVDDDGANSFYVADLDGDGQADIAVALTGLAAAPVATDIIA